MKYLQTKQVEKDILQINQLFIANRLKSFCFRTQLYSDALGGGGGGGGWWHQLGSVFLRSYGCFREA